ncbi:murein biosynthesis protein MurJ, partial [Streptomyces sp. NPDC059766]
AAGGPRGGGVWGARGRPPARAGRGAGAVTVVCVFVLVGLALGAQGFAPALRSVCSATRRLAHGLFR